MISIYIFLGFLSVYSSVDFSRKGKDVNASAILMVISFILAIISSISCGVLIFDSNFSKSNTKIIPFISSILWNVFLLYYSIVWMLDEIFNSKARKPTKYKKKEFI
jgi:quinol-cytochrome oxidoreductase complex cytochrome b subunit